MELLSPAGNLETAIAAFDGGADAVYCGLGRFNARERAENFTPETLGKLLDFAHLNGKKVYLTLNTLIWESEAGALFEQLLELDKLRPDALIVQDPGVTAIVRKYFPQIPLHASTQMGIHNSAGAELVRSLGFKRVILERQITLEELRLISRNTTLELEVFLHGSLCCSLSGRCLLSHAMYGESGNRGRCKQPCRRAFNSPGKNTGMRILSPADLAGNTLLEELDKLGVTSLKIEGRLRTPDYIWKTARAYRILLDAPGDPAASLEAEKIFRSVPGRKKSTGFYFNRDWKKLIDPETSGTFGELCAGTLKVIRTGMLVKVNTTLHLGDRLRVMPLSSGEGESFTLAAMENFRRAKIIRAKSGETVFIPGKFRAEKGYEIRRIGENGFDFSRRAAALPSFRREININVKCSSSSWSAEIDGITGKWEMPTAFAPAEKQPLSPEKVKEVFAGGMPEGFRAGNITVFLDGNFFVPAATLKSLRRSCWEFFAPLLGKADLFPEHPAKMEDFYNEIHRQTTTLQPPEPGRKSFIIPPFTGEKDLPLLKEKIAETYADGTRDFTVTHWHGFALLENLENIRIHVTYPFHISNSFAVKLAAELGASTVSVTPECSEEEFALLQKHSILPLEKAAKDVPLLASRLPLAPGIWEHSGKKFRITQKDGLSLQHAHDTAEVSG